jgi:hypothetical protein
MESIVDSFYCPQKASEDLILIVSVELDRA